MKDDNQENRPRMRYFRYAVFSFTALLVLSLGFALIPAEPPAPAETPFSERARAAALEEALQLRAAGLELAASGRKTAAGETPAAPLESVVTLLTIQARALLLPGDPASAAASATSTASPPVRASPSVSPPSPAPPALATVAEFAAALAASGQQRLKDAETADGGMARLLAGAGTAQLLAAGRLGIQSAPAEEDQPHEGTAQDGMPGSPQSPDPAEASGCPATPGRHADASNGTAEGNGNNGTSTANSTSASASAGAALAATAEAELEAVYGYQAALTRLPPEGVPAASDFLQQHHDLADQARTFSLKHCGIPAPQPPGYVLDQGFLDAPAAGLARLEADTLPAYGDLVAVADGETRLWALAALQGAARRAQHWGAGPNPLPGLVLDEAQLPQLAS